MYRPAFFDDDFFNEFLGFPAERPPHRKEYDMIRSDILESADGYMIAMELPGYDKDEISIKLEDGYLTVTADKKPPVPQEQEPPKFKVIRRERHFGRCARRFFVGKNLNQDELKARFENGILFLNFPKEDARKVETAKYITIE